MSMGVAYAQSKREDGFDGSGQQRLRHHLLSLGSGSVTEQLALYTVLVVAGILTILILCKAIDQSPSTSTTSEMQPLAQPDNSQGNSHSPSSIPLSNSFHDVV